MIVIVYLYSYNITLVMLENKIMYTLSQQGGKRLRDVSLETELAKLIFLL